MIHLQRGINFLEIEVSDITAGRSGQDISLIDELFIKIHGNMIFDLTVFDLLVILPDFQFGIFKRIIGDLEEFRMFSDPGDIFGCDLFPIADTDLDEIGRILRFTVIIKFHREYLQIHYTTIYNTVQHTYNKKIQGLDTKKAATKPLFDLLCIFNCRTPVSQESALDMIKQRIMNDIHNSSQHIDRKKVRKRNDPVRSQ